MCRYVIILCYHSTVDMLTGGFERIFLASWMANVRCPCQQPPPDDTTDSCDTTRHNSLGPSGPLHAITLEVQDPQDISVEVLLALHDGQASGRIRPTAQQPYPYGGSKGGLHFEATFDKHVGKTPSTVRNPL